jgi:hypothetical protein
MVDQCSTLQRTTHDADHGFSVMFNGLALVKSFWACVRQSAPTVNFASRAFPRRLIDKLKDLTHYFPCSFAKFKQYAFSAQPYLAEQLSSMEASGHEHRRYRNMGKQRWQLIAAALEKQDCEIPRSSRLLNHLATLFNSGCLMVTGVG